MIHVTDLELFHKSGETPTNVDFTKLKAIGPVFINISVNKDNIISYSSNLPTWHTGQMIKHLEDMFEDLKQEKA